MTPSPKSVPVLIYRTYKYVTFYGKRDFVNVITLRTLIWENCSGLLYRSIIIKKVLVNRKKGAEESKKAI